jgi:uncharacterized RDD family membrane protein YckC
MNDSQSKAYAGFWQRVRAFALDYIIILFYLAALTLFSLIINGLFSVNEWLFVDRVRAQLTGFFLITLPVALYFTFGESSVQQATWGKKRVGLMVTGPNGARISFWRALARTFLKFIPWELSHTLIWEIYFSPQANSLLINYGFILVYGLIGLNMASLLMTKQHQTLYDLLANTYVTKMM